MSGQVAGTVALPADASAVSIVSDGLVFEIDDTSKTATLVGSAATPPKGDLSVPASVTSGTTTYEVTSIAKNAFAKCPELTSISLPATLREVDSDAVAGCASLKSITVSAKNEAFASHDGMLFTKDYTRLLLIPEGMEGAANIPGSTTTVPAQALSRCLLMGSSLTAGDGSAAFETLNGMLFTKDLKTLVSCPPAIGNAVVLPAETETIGEYALAGCKDLTSITALGNVREINPTAFAEEVKATAKVALPAGESKAVWEQAGFQHFAEPAEPGATTRPETEAEATSGLVFTLLDDYTLSVTWEGAEDPTASLEIPASAEINGVSYRVSTIATNAFANRGSLTSVKLPTSIISIGEAAFAGCANLADIQLPGNLSEIGERAFEATSLTDIWLPASVQSIGPRAFAACESLTRIVARNIPEVADDALVGCANLSIYSPYNEANTYPWNLGLIANNNHLLPYGLALPEEPLALEVGQSASLFDNGLNEAPEPCEVSFSYAAKPISVAPDGTVTGKAEGTSEVTATLALEGQELARTTRTVEVTAVPEAPAQPSNPAPSTDDATNTSPTPEPAATPALLSADNAQDHISLTAALATGETFKATAPTGQTLTCTVLADEPASVEVALADESKPTDGSIVGGIVIPAIVIDPNTGTEYVVKGIGVQGFMDVNLTAVSFETGSQVSYIGEMAFNACKLLSTVVLPASLQTIAPKAFGHCFNLTTLEIPDSVTSIGINAFQRCVSLSYISIGSGVTVLPDSLFYGDFSLETLVVRGSIATFGVNLFQDTRPSSLKVYVSSAANKTAWENANQNGSYWLTPSNIIVTTSFYTVTFKDCGDNGKDIVIRVADGEAVEMPSTTKRGFGLAGWYENSSFNGERWDFSRPVDRDVILHPRWVESFVQEGLEFTMRPDGNGVAVGAVNPASMTGNLVLPESVTIAGITYPVTAIAPNGFALSMIDSVVLPSSLESIEVSAFNTSSVRTTNLGSLTNLKKIAAEAFIKTNLTELVIPASVETMQRAAFHSCKALESVTFAESSVLTALPDECFIQCTSLKTILLPANLKSIEYNAFYKNTSLATIVLPESLELIGSMAFIGCTALQSIEIPTSVTSIGQEALKGCTKLRFVKLPAGMQKLGASAFAGCTALSTISAFGSLTDVGVAEAFDATAKKSATVLLPTEAQDGSGQKYDEMAQMWTGTYKFTNVACTGGDLPMVNNVGKVSWRFEVTSLETGLGTLTLEQTEQGTIDTLADWADPGNFNKQPEKEFWMPLRHKVQKVVMTSTDGSRLRAVNSVYWFAGMPNLNDVSEAYVPESVTSTCFMFDQDESLTSLPDDFTLPESVTDITAMFRKVRFTEYPKGLVNFPANIERMNSTFAGACFTTLPEGFSLGSYEQLVDVAWMFGSSYLTTLPKGFELPRNIISCTNMFSGCQYLTSLPEGFTVPKPAGSFQDSNGVVNANIQGMFSNCYKLTYLPASFDFEPLQDVQGFDTLFSIPSGPIQTYYGGVLPEGVSPDMWSNRHIIDSAAAQQGVQKAAFLLPDELGVYPDDPWARMVTNAGGILPTDLDAPERAGQVFTLWYADEACTQRFDFSKPLVDQATVRDDGTYALYGKYVAGSHGGQLPCELNTGTATWTFSDDGTLYIRGGGTISEKHWDQKDPEGTGDLWNDCWGPYRHDVRKISMAPSLKSVETQWCWFARMDKLVDISEVVVPQGCIDPYRWFQACTSLEAIPEGFSVGPALYTRCMFQDCTSLRLIASDFRLNENAISSGWMFFRCSSLTSLPEGFYLPETVKEVTSMFYICPALTTLPASFTIPTKALQGDVGILFYTGLRPDGSRTPTYYAGDDPNVINFDWESQNRTLITKDADAEGFGMQQAVFKMQVEQLDGTFAWETRSTAWSNKQGILADPGTPVHPDGYGFTGWCTDETCLTPFDFTKPLPGRTTLYGKWVKHGGRDTVEGTLPVDDVGSAWWSITTDGAFNIKCEEGASIDVNDFAWNDDCKKYWEPYANEVRSLNMHENVRARSMKGWFKNMTQLEDVRTGFFIPDNCVRALHLFYNDENLRYLPSGFFPENCKIGNMWGMFQGCRSLESLPADFVLPESVTTIGCLFYDASSLTSLPEAFQLHKGITNMDEAFFMCSSLRSLPENLVIPESVISIKSAFVDCSKLTVLPSGLLSRLSEAAINQLNERHVDPNTDSVGTFGLRSSFAINPLPTYFPAPEAQQKLIHWTDQRRKLVTDPATEGQALVKLMVPNADGADFYSWQTLMVAKGESLNQPPAPARMGGSFVGWYEQSNYQTQVTFPLAVNGETTLYAKYINNSGSLPTTDGGERASWELTDDGTLRISCEPGATIADFGWINDFEADNPSFLAMHWGPVRDKVKNVVMEKGLLAESMDFWFTDMSQLKDCSEVFVPEGVTSLHSCFKKTGIEAIPEGFVIPDTVENLHDCFFRCENLSKIAEDFSIPNSVTEMGGTFVFCSSLTSLPSGFQLPENLEIAANLFRETGLTTFPEGFTLPATVTDASYMVYRAYSFRTLPASFLRQESATGVPLNCRCMFKESGLMSLPADFTIPARVIDAIEMFRGTQLTSLPEGFAIEGTPTSVQSMFMNCPKLTYLPASLKLTPLRDAGVYTDKMFGWTAGEPGYTSETIATYYAGDDPEVLCLNIAETASVYWKNKFNRTLLWNGAGSQLLPDKTFKVSFQLQKPDATQPTEWMTVLATAGEDGVTRVAKPEEPSEFGYVFDGWYTDASFAAESKFSFGEDGTAEVKGDLPLYGRYTLRLSYDIPVTAKVTVDSSGNVEADAIQMKSFTPKTLMVSSVSVAEAPGAAKLFPKANERSKVLVVASFGRVSYSLALGDSLDGMLGRIPVATPAEPGVLDGQLSIDRDNAQINFQPGEDITSFAKLTWTITPKL